MATHRNGEMLRQDGVRVDKNLIMFFRHQFVLLLRAVDVAKEARTLADALLVNACTCRNDAGRIPLRSKRHFAKWQFFCLHTFL